MPIPRYALAATSASCLLACGHSFSPAAAGEVSPRFDVSIDAAAVRPVQIDTLSTPTGEWPVYDLGKVAEGRAYLLRYASRPDWFSVCVVRYPGTRPRLENGRHAIDEQPYRVRVGGKAFPITAFPGSMKCADNGEPVSPSIERLAAAVKAGRTLPYDRSAFAGFVPLRERRSRRDEAEQYRADRIYGRSSSVNAIGIVSGQGGEYGSSRGFISSDDAMMVAAAVAGDKGMFAEAAKRGRVQVMYGLSLPMLVIWSERHHQMRDPQLPFPGDRPYTNEGSIAGDAYGDEGTWCAPETYPFLEELGAVAGKCFPHNRDEAHLFNHGYAYWLATGDPRAALLQQAIQAYSLASNYRRSAGKYLPRFTAQRATLNQFSAMWKARDVALHLKTRSGNLFWPNSRTAKMSTDLWTGWKSSLARLDASRDPHDRSVSIFRGIDSNGDNAYSNFMIQAYGPEAAYLWASVGEPALLQRIGENFVLRFGLIGGTRGFYGAGSGSGFPILVDGRLPYRDTASFVDWVNGVSPHPADRFDAAPVHYALRGYWSLRLASDAVRRGWMPGIAGLDDAIRRTEAARDKTAKWKNSGIVDWKHAAVPFR